MQGGDNRGGPVQRVLAVLLLVVGGVQAKVIATYTFGSAEDMVGWRTSRKWHDVMDADAGSGSALWSDKFGGSAKLSVSGAGGELDFWRPLPCDLQFGDRIYVRFSLQTALMNNSHFNLKLGPAVRAGHVQHVTVSPEAAGSYSVDMPIWMPLFSAGDPFGIQFVIWPGSKTVYVREIEIVRED